MTIKMPSLLATAALAVATLGLTGASLQWHSPRAVEFPGVVEMHEVNLASRVGGRVVEVLVAEGDRVNPGQVLLRIDAGELSAKVAEQAARCEAAQLRLALARSGPRKEEIAAAQAAMDAAAARLKCVQSGPRVEAIAQARYELQLSEAHLAEKDATLRRLTPLASQRVVSSQELERARSQYDQATALRKKAASQLEMLQAGSRAEEIDEAAAKLAHATALYNELAAGTRAQEIAILQAEVAEQTAVLRQLQVQLDETEVRASSVGKVEALTVRAGDVLAPNQSAVRILSQADVWVTIYVPETELGRLRVGQPVSVTVDSYPRRTFPGRVNQIGSTAEFTPRNVQTFDSRRHQVFAVKVNLGDDDGIFKSGMAACVQLPLQD